MSNKSTYISPNKDAIKFEPIKDTNDYQLSINEYGLVVSNKFKTHIEVLLAFLGLKYQDRAQFYNDNAQIFDELQECDIINIAEIARNISHTLSKKKNTWVIDVPIDFTWIQVFEKSLELSFCHKLKGVPKGYVVVDDDKRIVSDGTDICVSDAEKIFIEVPDITSVPAIYIIKSYIVVMDVTERREQSMEYQLMCHKKDTIIKQLNAQISALTGNSNPKIIPNNTEYLPLYDAEGKLVAKIDISLPTNKK